MANSDGKTGFLSEGSLVEVKIEGAWYEAHIITRCAESKDQFRVLSHDRRNIFEKKLRYIIISQIRPLPPLSPADQRYEPRDVVDVFDCEGWWKGVVSGVYTLEGKTYYTVVLSETPPRFQDKVFTSKKMRFHWVWTDDGKWIRPPKPKEIPDHGEDSSKAMKSSTDLGGNLAVKGKNLIPNHKKSGLKTTGVVDCSKKRQREVNALAAENPNDDSAEVTDKGYFGQSYEVNVQEKSKRAKNKDLPFIKSSPLWEQIASLEVFKKLPQNPHFSPLKDCNENAREGMAMGHMWNFASLVEKVSKLQIEEPRSVFEGYLEALAVLEKVGFDVKAVVDRINELLALKTKQEKLVVELKEMFLAKAGAPW